MTAAFVPWVMNQIKYHIFLIVTFFGVTMSETYFPNKISTNIEGPLREGGKGANYPQGPEV